MTRTNMIDRIFDLYWANQPVLPRRQRRLARLILALDLLVLVPGLLHLQTAPGRLAAMIIHLVDTVMPPFCLAVCCVLACLGKAALNDFPALCRFLRLHGIAAPSLLRLICRAVLRLYRPCLTGLCVFLCLSGLLCLLPGRREAVLLPALIGCHLLIWILTGLFLWGSSAPDRLSRR